MNTGTLESSRSTPWWCCVCSLNLDLHFQPPLSCVAAAWKASTGIFVYFCNLFTSVDGPKPLHSQWPTQRAFRPVSDWSHLWSSMRLITQNRLFHRILVHSELLYPFAAALPSAWCWSAHSSWKCSHSILQPDSLNTPAHLRKVTPCPPASLQAGRASATSSCTTTNSLVMDIPTFS